MHLITMLFPTLNRKLEKQVKVTLNNKYNQTRIKCLRPISSLFGLQGQNFFADAINKNNILQNILVTKIDTTNFLLMKL